jgi:hypothetical protein
MAADPAAGNLIGFRLDQLERKVDANTKWREETAASLAGRNVQFDTLKDEVSALRSDVKSLRQVLLGLSITIAGSSVVFGLSVLLATGKI